MNEIVKYEQVKDKIIVLRNEPVLIPLSDTERGLYMLATILKSKQATQT